MMGMSTAVISGLTVMCCDRCSAALLAPNALVPGTPEDSRSWVVQRAPAVEGELSGGSWLRQGGNDASLCREGALLT